MKGMEVFIVLFSISFMLIAAAALYVAFGERAKIYIMKKAHSMHARKDSAADSKNNTATEYNIYNMNLRERLACIAAAGAVVFTAGYIFYRSIILSVLLLPIALIYPRVREKELIGKRKAELNMQFREALYSISSSLSAGKSIEVSFRDAVKELSIQYPDNSTYIIVELRQINKRVEMNETIEEALSDFALRSHLEDIRSFAEVFAICKRTGGNLVQVVKNTADIISEKIDIRQEINVLLTEKRLEHKILNLMPVVIVLLLSTSAEEFMAPVFSEVLGRIAMTVSLLLFAAAYFISKKIMNIEV